MSRSRSTILAALFVVLAGAIMPVLPDWHTIVIGRVTASTPARPKGRSRHTLAVRELATPALIAARSGVQSCRGGSRRPSLPETSPVSDRSYTMFGSAPRALRPVTIPLRC